MFLALIKYAYNLFKLIFLIRKTDNPDAESNRMDFTLKQLGVFVAVAETGSTLAAAQTLGISQSAVSQSLSEMESKLDVRLFDRWKKKILLNAQGRTLLPRAKLLLVNARELNELFLSGRNQLSGTLRLGASLTIANYVLPEILDRFATSHPSIKMEVDCRNKQVIISKIENFTIDIGLIAGTCSNIHIQSSLWLKDELCVFAAPDHPLAQKSQCAPEDLVRYPWTMREEGSGTREVFLSALPDHLKSLNIAMEFESPEAIKQAVERGHSLSCLSRLAIGKELLAGSLMELPTPYLKMRRDYFLLTHKQRNRSILLRDFLRFCRFKTTLKQKTHTSEIST